MVYTSIYWRLRPLRYNKLMENQIINSKWENVLPTLPPGSVQLVCMDPPYGVTPALWDHRPDWNVLMTGLWRVCGDTGQLWCFVRMPWAVEVYLAARKAG